MCPWVLDTLLISAFKQSRWTHRSLRSVCCLPWRGAKLSSLAPWLLMKVEENKSASVVWVSVFTWWPAWSLNKCSLSHSPVTRRFQGQEGVISRWERRVRGQVLLFLRCSDTDTEWSPSIPGSCGSTWNGRSRFTEMVCPGYWDQITKLGHYYLDELKEPRVSLAEPSLQPSITQAPTL